MPYIRGDGTVEEGSRSLFRLSIFSEVLWFLVNTIGLFFNTLIDPRAPLPAGKYVVARRAESRSGGGRAGTSGGGEGDVKKGPNIKTLPKNCASGG
jgi:hypothetical protein